MLSRREIGVELVKVAEKLIEKKVKGENDKEATLYMGISLGLLTVLGKIEESKKHTDYLAYLQTVIDGIIKK